MLTEHLLGQILYMYMQSFLKASSVIFSPFIRMDSQGEWETVDPDPMTP